MTPAWVIAPEAVRFNAPVASEAAISMALASKIVTAEPEKSRLPKLAVVASPRTIELPVELNWAKPVTETAPESVMPPFVRRSKEVAVIAAISIPSPSCIVTSPPMRSNVAAAVSRVIVPAEPAAPSLMVKVVPIISVAASFPVSITPLLPTRVTVLEPASIKPTDKAFPTTEVMCMGPSASASTCPEATISIVLPPD